MQRTHKSRSLQHVKTRTNRSVPGLTLAQGARKKERLLSFTVSFFMEDDQETTSSSGHAREKGKQVGSRRNVGTNGKNVQFSKVKQDQGASGS